MVLDVSNTNYVAQDKNGDVQFFKTMPRVCGIGREIQVTSEGASAEGVKGTRKVKSWKKRVFDLSKYDFEIYKGKLVGIPNNAPDWLMILKEIDMKAFDILTRDSRGYQHYSAAGSLEEAFSWHGSRQGWDYWNKLSAKIWKIQGKRAKLQAD